MCSSSERSAANRFNRLFSSSNCRSSRVETHPQVRVLLFPRIEGGIPYPKLAAEVANRGPSFSLAQGPLLSCETAEAAIVLLFQAAVVFRGDVSSIRRTNQNEPASPPPPSFVEVRFSRNKRILHC